MNETENETKYKNKNPAWNVSLQNRYTQFHFHLNDKSTL